MKKRFLCILFILLLLISVGCAGQPPVDSQTNSVSGTDGESGNINTKEAWAPLELVEDIVIACDQRNRRVVVYDLGKLTPGDSLDPAEIWSFSFRTDWGTPSNVSGVKYRTNTVFGDVIITCCSGGYAAIIKYPSKEVVWETRSCGNNPHSVEILPNGDLACASSTGGTIQLYRTSALLKGDQKTADTWKTYKLKGAHGVLWDPTEEVLWALGDDELVAYGTKGGDDALELTLVSGYGATLPQAYPSGHDLSADFLDKNCLLLTTNGGAIRFNKTTCEFSADYQFSNVLKIAGTGFGNNPNGNYAFTRRHGGKGTPWEGQPFAAWCTPIIHFGQQTAENKMVVTQYYAADSAFYKVRIFHGEYQ